MSTKIGRTEYVTATEAAEMLGMKLDTFTSRVSRARAGTIRAQGFPLPALEMLGRKLYKLTEVRRYRDNRPGAGARTDLVKRAKK